MLNSEDIFVRFYILKFQFVTLLIRNHEFRILAGRRQIYYRTEHMPPSHWMRPEIWANGKNCPQYHNLLAFKSGLGREQMLASPHCLAIIGVVSVSLNIVIEKYT